MALCGQYQPADGNTSLGMKREMRQIEEPETALEILANLNPNSTLPAALSMALISIPDVVSITTHISSTYANRLIGHLST
jgi:hypothetical protein